MVPHNDLAAVTITPSISHRDRRVRTAHVTSYSTLTQARPAAHCGVSIAAARYDVMRRGMTSVNSHTNRPCTRRWAVSSSSATGQTCLGWGRLSRPVWSRCSGRALRRRAAAPRRRRSHLRRAEPRRPRRTSAERPPGLCLYAAGRRRSTFSPATAAESERTPQRQRK